MVFAASSFCFDCKELKQRADALSDQLQSLKRNKKIFEDKDAL
jgi:hypothetical protein